MRRSRHHFRDNGVAIRATELSIGTLRLFDTFRLLPLNYMHALAGGGNYCAYRDLCTRMTWAGLLNRKTLMRKRKTDEMVYMGEVLSKAHEEHRKMMDRSMEGIRFAVAHQLGELTEAVDTRLANIEELLRAILGERK